PEAMTGQIADGHVSRLATDANPFERRGAHFVRVPGSTPQEDLLLVALSSADANAPRTDGGQSPERLHAVLLKLRGELGKRFHVSQLIGESDAMIRVREQVRVAAEARTRVLVM